MDTSQRAPGLEILSQDTMAGDPMTQFAGWLDQAQRHGLPEPTAMVLATTSAEGRVRMLSQADSEPYYRSRPRGSQLGAWASRQSQVIGSRAELESRVAELEQRWPAPAEVPMPDFWGGYVLVPDTVEFWQSGAYRLHDRLRYRRDGDGWAIERLSP